MPQEEKKSIFFDPTQKRWKRIKVLVFVTSILLAILFMFFIGTLFINVPLGHVLFPSPPKFTPVNVDVDSLSNREAQASLAQYTAKNPSELNQLKRIVFLSDSQVGLVDLKKHLGEVDVVIGDWLHLTTGKGEFIENNLQTLTNVLNEIRSQKKSIQVIMSLDLWEENDNQQLSPEILSDSASRQKIIQQLLNYVTQYHLNGVHINLQDLNFSSKDDFSLFVEELAQVFHAHQLSVSISLPMDNPIFDRTRLANSVDFVVLNPSDEHWANSSPGPIVNIPGFKQLEERNWAIPPEKRVWVLKNGGYDWQEYVSPAQSKDFPQIMHTAKLAEAQIYLDPVSLNSSFRYIDNLGHKHQVWFLDAVSTFNQLAILQSTRSYGVALQALGGEDPSVWQIFDAPVLGKVAAEKLQTIRMDYQMSQEGKGDVFSVFGSIKEGKRRIVFDDKSGLIVAQEYEILPTSYIIHHYGLAANKMLALTFDDGPNPPYTTKILDILKNTHTPATFFIIGQNGLSHPKLLQREIQEGHELGNHTFTHPNIAKISRQQLMLELNLTQRVMQSFTGKRTLLFRPPYELDSPPKTMEEVQVVRGLNQLGYLIVGSAIDPADWRTPGVQTIVQRVLAGVHNGKGNIILMHDGGGKTREQTVAALPIVLSVLKSEGYQFVSLSQLLHQPQSAIMLKSSSSWDVWLDKISFKLLAWGSSLITILFYFSIGAVVIRLLFVMIWAFLQKVQKRPKLSLHTNLSVTAIISAYNEEKVIVKTIIALLNAEHPPSFQLIVVDDGSTDQTLNVLRDNFGDNPIVKIVSQENSGKSAAFNNAISCCKSDVIISVDADTICQRNTILHLIAPFVDPKVGAVAGIVRVGNQINGLTCLQALEYVTSQNLDRRALGVLNAIPVVPGAVGAWRRTAVLAAGGFTDDTLTEDFDLTFKVRELGYVIAFSEDAVGVTEAPDNINGFLRQRYRWMLGTLQGVWKHIHTACNPSYGAFGFITVPNVILQIIIQLIAPLVDLYFIISIIHLGLSWWFHRFDDLSFGLISIITFYLLSVGINMIATIIAFIMDKKEKKRLLLWVFAQQFYYRQLLYYTMFKALMGALRGRQTWWGRSYRKATVEV